MTITNPKDILQQQKQHNFIKSGEDVSTIVNKEIPAKNYSSNKKVVISFHIDKELLQKLDEVAKKRGVTRSASINFSISKFISENL